MTRNFALLVILLPPLVHAEIIIPTGAVEEAGYAYQHPAVRSLVFVSPEARQAAILPPAPVFMSPPPLLMRAPALMPLYPPVRALSGVNQSAHPINRDNANYNLQRAHGFSQDLYRDGSPYYFDSPAYGNGWMAFSLPYVPAAMPGFNQPARPSNRDNATYNLERAHRFSMDGYRQP